MDITDLERLLGVRAMVQRQAGPGYKREGPVGHLVLHDEHSGGGRGETGQLVGAERYLGAVYRLPPLGYASEAVTAVARFTNRPAGRGGE